METTTSTFLKKVDEFHEHLKQCRQCRENPFALCPKGERILSSMIGDDKNKATCAKP